MITLTLPQAHRLLRQHAAPTPSETVPLEQALGRVPTLPIRARLPVPSFPQSCRDGYALRSRDTDNGAQALKIMGEIAAGRTCPATRIKSGEAYRIMTGGALPPGADSIIAYERLEREARDHIVVSATYPPGRHIRSTGSDLRKNQIIVSPGQRVAADHLPLLATAGVSELMVHARPRVGLLCTGSELLEDTGETPLPGSLISGNRFLLAALIRQAGAIPQDLGTVGDDSGAIAAALQVGREEKGLDIIISTGGMGPGKYDLVGRALDELQGQVLYHELKLRPGRATMAALLGRTVFFGLPGPPPAVHLLFHLLAAPTIEWMGGMRESRPKPLKAHLIAPINLRQGGITQLKGAVLSAENGRLQVRLAAFNEVINAVIMVPARRRHFATNELVRVHPL